MPRKNNTQPHPIFKYAARPSCKLKRRFTTEQLAEIAADDQMSYDYKLELSVYKCDMCHGWHLTRQARTK